MAGRETFATLYVTLFRIDGIDTVRATALGGITATVLLSELLLYVGTVWVSLVIYLLMFGGVLVLPLVVPAERDLFRAFALIPLFRLVNLGMPVMFEPTLVWLALVYGSLAIATVVTARTLPAARLLRVGYVKQLLLYSPVVAGTAVAFAAIEYRILIPEPLVASLAGAEGVLFVVVIVGLAGLGEELLFREVIQSTVASQAGPGSAITVSTLLFAALHSGLVIPEAIGWAALTGAVFSVYYQLSGNWLVTGVLRGTMNLLVYGVFPLWGTLSVLLQQVTTGV